MNESAVRPRSVLDEKPLRIPIAGRIRTGIKVLTKAGAANKLAAEIYEKGVAANLSYVDIDRQIKEACKTEKSLLVPRNTPFFRVVPQDFTYPETARLIFEKYAEDRGDRHGRQLYRFPVVFAFDDWLQNMPHGLTSWTASTLKYQSQYDAVGDRFCMTHAAAEMHGQSRRAVRKFGGRTLVMRQDNGGRCIPEKCPEYQTKACKLSGRVLFYIPGIPGSSLIELGTTSFYSLDQMHAQMELVSRLRMGRISGVLNGKPIFTLTKVEEEVSMIDDEGNPKKALQYLVKMETDLPMTQLMANAEMRAIAAPQQESTAALAAPTERVIDHDAPLTHSVGAAPPAQKPKSRINQLREEIAGMVEDRGEEDLETFGRRMVREYGTTWSTDEKLLSQVKYDLETQQ